MVWVTEVVCEPLICCRQPSGALGYIGWFWWNGNECLRGCLGCWLYSDEGPCFRAWFRGEGVSSNLSRGVILERAHLEVLSTCLFFSFFLSCGGVRSLFASYGSVSR